MSDTVTQKVQVIGENGAILQKVQAHIPNLLLFLLMNGYHIMKENIIITTIPFQNWKKPMKLL